MTKIVEHMESLITVRGMDTTHAQIIMKAIKQDPTFAQGSMNGRWEEAKDMFSPFVVTMVWLSVRDRALTYIETYLPQAPYKAHFLSSMQLHKGRDSFLQHRLHEEAAEALHRSELDESIVGTGESHSAEWIKRWVMYQRDTDGEYSDLASELYESYWGNAANPVHAPNPRVFYYVWNEKNNIGFRQVTLERDTVKSPRKQHV